MLRISVSTNQDSIRFTLAGRLAGPWANELGRAWTELAPTLGDRKLLIDLRDATYADATGLLVLRDIYTQTTAQFITGSPWTRYIAEEVTRPVIIRNAEES